MAGGGGGVVPPFSISDLIRIGAGEVREGGGGGDVPNKLSGY